MNFNMEITIGDLLTVVSFLGAILAYCKGQRSERCRATIEAWKDLEEVLVELEKFTPAELRNIAENGIKKEYREQYRNARSMAAKVEHFCVGVKRGIYDPKTAFELGGGFLNGAIKSRLQPIIDKANRNHDLDYYANTHWVMNELDKIDNKRRGRNHGSAEM
ncbi:MAG: hypothetical protein Q4E57_02265 [Eubacteriales bacterium]|nr:hypothetical protein [Eubacteriales bacterium]